jgi:hypothetical protein
VVNWRLDDIFPCNMFEVCMRMVAPEPSREQKTPILQCRWACRVCRLCDGLLSGCGSVFFDLNSPESFLCIFRYSKWIFASSFCEWIDLNVGGMCIWNEHIPQLEELCLKLSFAIGISAYESWAPLWRKCLFTYRLVDFLRFDMWPKMLIVILVFCKLGHNSP